MANWKLGSAFAGAACVLGLASQPAQAQINTMPPPALVPVPVPVPAPSPPPITPPPGGMNATPTGNPGEWVTENDYPLAALREERQGITAFHVTIGVNGMVTDCAVTGTSGSSDLDEATCRLVSIRARFLPARDAKGGAIVGQYNNRIRWLIPAEDSPDALVQLAELTRVVTFFVETDGSVTHCSMLINGVDYTASKYSLCANRKEYALFHDVSGKAVRRKVTMTSTVKITNPDAKPVSRKRRRGR